MPIINDNTQAGSWTAGWITRPVQDHRRWERYAVDVKAAVEAGAAAVLFAVRDERRYCGCRLDAASREVVLYSVDNGDSSEWGRAPARELETLPAEIAVSIRLGESEVSVFLDGRLALASSAPAGLQGTIGLAAEKGGSSVFRELRVTDEGGRALYVNRFYDPSVITFTAGQIDASGSGLRLGGDTVAICESPVPVDSPQFRQSFVVEDSVVRAIARVYCTGWYELSVNGRKADPGVVLAPANSPYDRRLLYDTYDVTDLLLRGGNAIGLWLGNGYNLNYSRWGWKWRRDKAAILQLDIELADGTVQQVVTDEFWQTASSPILMNDIYDGETFDGRKARAGWDRYGFDGEGWTGAVPAEAPAGSLEPNAQPPIRSWSPLEPVQATRVREGVAVYDFGQNIAGWARVRVKGAAGSRLVLRYSELVDAEGNIDPWTNRNAKATDIYIMGGDGEETYEPKFTYHGFRYVEVSGDAELTSIAAVPIHCDVREAGRFGSSDGLLNRIQGNIRWSILNNLVSIPTDCCQRDERTPCLMDSAVVEEAAIHNFDMRQYYRKWLGDIADSATNPDWSGDKVTLPWHLYWHYGDEDALREHYGPMKAYMDHLAEKWPDGIVQEGFGDWCPPNEDGWDNYFGEVAIVNTALYCRQAAVTADTAAVLGLEDDRKRYGALAESVKAAFHNRFHQGNGIYGSGSQTAQLMPLAFGIVPEAIVPAAVRGLTDAIAAKGNHLDTGIYGTRYLMDVLAEHGHIDLAYQMLTQTDYPGFGYQIGQGATTLWEQWSFKGAMHSHDHAMFGGIGASFYTRLGGIRPLAPGYGRIGIKPYMPERLEWAEAALETVRGRIASSWRKEGERLQLAIEIPPGTSAVVALPVRAAAGGEERAPGGGERALGAAADGGQAPNGSKAIVGGAPAGGTVDGPAGAGSALPIVWEEREVGPGRHSFVFADNQWTIGG